MWKKVLEEANVFRLFRSRTARVLALLALVACVSVPQTTSAQDLQIVNLATTVNDQGVETGVFGYGPEHTCSYMRSGPGTPVVMAFCGSRADFGLTEPNSPLLITTLAVTANDQEVQTGVFQYGPQKACSYLKSGTGSLIISHCGPKADFGQ